jgi:hypothetical protein
VAISQARHLYETRGAVLAWTAVPGAKALCVLNHVLVLSALAGVFLAGTRKQASGIPSHQLLGLQCGGSACACGNGHSGFQRRLSSRAEEEEGQEEEEEEEKTRGRSVAEYSMLPSPPVPPSRPSRAVPGNSGYCSFCVAERGCAHDSAQGPAADAGLVDVVVVVAVAAGVAAIAACSAWPPRGRAGRAGPRETRRVGHETWRVRSGVPMAPAPAWRRRSTRGRCRGGGVRSRTRRGSLAAARGPRRAAERYPWHGEAAAAAWVDDLAARLLFLLLLVVVVVGW